MCLQAEKPSWNSIGIFKITNISGKRHELVPSKSAADDSDMDSDSSDSDEDSDNELGGSGVPVLQARFLYSFATLLSCSFVASSVPFGREISPLISITFSC